MRVRNDKAILDELDQTKHKAESLDEELPSFNAKNAPNLIIQSKIQNTPSPATQPPPEQPVVYHPPPGPPTTGPAYPHHSVYYTNPPAPVLLQKPGPVKYIQQPVQYVEEYIE